LLFTYSILSIPVLLGLLVGLNLLVWSDARINYTFIFGLFTFIVLCEMLMEEIGFDVRTRLDYRAYPEVNQKNIIVVDFFPLTSGSDPGNPSCNTRLRILVFFLWGWIREPLASSVARFCVFIDNQSTVYNV
jgi:hypothetical protein